MVTTPSGSTAHVNIPDGLTPGQTFAVQVPLTQLVGTSQTVVGTPVDEGAGLVGKGLVIVVAGAPCSGKGTQCQRLAEKFGFIHLSTGDIFRDHVKRGTELGKQAQEYLNRNCFVPDEMVINFIRDRLKQPDAIEKGVLLDGFPRTADQASALTKQINVDQFILLQVPDKALVKRAMGRRVDSETGSIYHVDFLPPSSEVIPRLVCRDSDKDEHAVRVRLNTHRESHRRILPYFLGKVERIDGMRDPSEVLDAIIRTLKESQTAASQLSSSGTPQISNTCVICMDQPADFLVAPCGHQCACEDCLKAVQETTGKCPICRSRVESIQRVFKCTGDTDGDHVQKKVSDPDAVHQDLDDKLDSTCVEDESWSEDESSDISNSADLPSLHIAPCDDCPFIDREFSEHDVMVRVQVPESQKRTPADICCLVDISGSMGTNAVESDGVVNKDGLSILDIAKHALKTVVHSLCDEDRLSLVAFDHKAETVLELSTMDKDGRDKAVSVLENLAPRGQTNIWAGLLAAMDSLRVSVDVEAAGRQKTILLLTDGQPNVCPPRGHLTELRDYKDKHPEFSFQINTFGFGYNLNSELLLDLALEGHGTYAFIPDAVIVGTVFVNSVANVLSTLTQNATLHICPQGKAELTGPVLGDHAALDESWGRVVTLGPLQQGQSREVVVPLRIPAGSEPYLEVFLTYPTTNGERKVRAETSDRTSSPDAKLAHFRNTLVSTGYDAVKQGCAGKNPELAVQKLLEDVESERIVSSLSADGRFAALKADLVDGRMSKSIKGKERFNRWGKHYLRALMRSHQLQICTNFMDPGLQVYGGELFRELRDKGDQIFLTLPKPKPSNARASAPRASVTSTAQNRSNSPDMNRYYAGAGGGCFGETSSVIVVTNDGMEVKRRVPDLRPGDEVRVADAGLAKVRCVVRIARSPSKKLVALPGGLTITPKHPVRIAGKWMLPGEMRQEEVANPSGFVYNFVLDQCHILLVDGVECVTWGHGIEDSVVRHPYYGTDEVISDLSALTGWDQGFVMVNSCIRDSSGQVTRLRGEVMPATTLNNCAVTN
jgi:adenylate kinase